MATVIQPPSYTGHFDCYLAACLSVAFLPGVGKLVLHRTCLTVYMEINRSTDQLHHNHKGRTYCTVSNYTGKETLRPNEDLQVYSWDTFKALPD